MEEIKRRLKDLLSWSDRLGSDEMNEINILIKKINLLGKNIKTESKSQKEKINLIREKLNLNLVTCGNCGAVIIHEINQSCVHGNDKNELSLTCPYCDLKTDLCDFPDLI
jgi:hypothetical protein